MSAVRTGIPPLIEQQLLALDKQIRDAAFVRGAARMILAACLYLAGGLLLDGLFALNNTVRGCLLLSWIALGLALLWRGVIRPSIAPVSLSSLAALVEHQYPELRERLTSLVELRGNEGMELAPGASTLMQDLLARQTVKALDQLSVDSVGSSHGPFKTALAGATLVLLLMAPFAWNADGYGLLWNRFFVPWGNSAWGTTLELNVVDGDQIVARGSDVPIHVTLMDRRSHREIEKNSATPLWLNWQDVNLASDSRRMEWDDDSNSFMTTIPRIPQSVTFNVTTSGAKSGTHRIDVSDPPEVTQFKMEIEPAAYTGLPAKILHGVPAEIRVSEFSRIHLKVEFQEPVADATLTWPVESLDLSKSGLRPDKRMAADQSFPFELSSDRRSGSVNVIAMLTGPFGLQAKNSFGLKYSDDLRMLIVSPDQPPEITLSGSDEPALVRSDDLIEQPIEVHDDFGLTAVEFHLETSNGLKRTEELSAEQRRNADVSHTFVFDLTPLALQGGQVVSYRIRAVDNRPAPSQQEVWSATRTLMINTSLKQIPDPKLAAETKSLEDELSKLRTDLVESKQELIALHEQIEKEALNRRPESNKNDRLAQLQQEQDELIERLQQLGDRLAERPMTEGLVPLTGRIAEEDLKIATERLEQSKNQTSRDQLEPVAQAVDRLGTANRQLQQLERQLNELNKLEQDLNEMNRMAQRAERVADQLEQLNKEQVAAAAQQKSETSQVHPSEQSQSEPIPQQPVAAAAEKGTPAEAQQANSTAPQEQGSPPPAETSVADNSREGDVNESEALQKLKDEGKKLADQMNDLLKKHPELLEAARREQQDQLNQLGDHARQLAVPQKRLAEALKQTADNTPAVASRPENVAAGNDHETTKVDQPTQEQGRSAAQQQEQIAREATRQALDLAQDVGADAAATKAATEFAKKANSAQQLAQSGQLADAATEAQKAQTAADEARQQLNPEGDSKSPQAQRSQQLADQQRENTRQLEQLAKSPEAARGAQLQGQRQLAEATKKLAEQIEQAANTLKSAPLNASQQAESGERARKSAEQAELSMKQSEQANQQNDPHQSAQAAADAADKLKQAADEVKRSTSPSTKSTPIPNKIGAQVVEASKQIQSAQQKLAQCNCPNPGPGSGTGKSGSKPGEPGIASANPSETKPTHQPGESQSEAKSKGNQPGNAGEEEASSQSDADKKGNQPGNSADPGGKPRGKNSLVAEQDGNQAGNSVASGDRPQGDLKQNPMTSSGDKPGSNRATGQSANTDANGKNQDEKNSELAQAAEQFRELAAMLRQARGELKENGPPRRPMKSQRPGRPMPTDQPIANSEPGEASADGGQGTTSTLELGHLDTELQQQARQNWGRLPGRLRTEILQGAGKKSHPEYTQRIKSYFDEITKPAK